MNNDTFLALVAKKYYIDKIKQNEIARFFKVSTMMVSRLLKEAETRGIVTFHVKTPWQMDAELGREIIEKYGLLDCYVFDLQDNEELPMKLGFLLADYFCQILPKKNVIVGLSWGYTISKFVEALPYIKVDNLSLVQLTGSFPYNGFTDTPTEMLNRMSKKMDGKIYFLHAPLYVATEQIKNNLLNDPLNFTIEHLAAKADINIIGASELSLTSNTLKSGTIGKNDFNELVKLKSIGDLAGTFLDKNGIPIQWSKSVLNTGVGLEQIRKAKNVICVAGEKRKLGIIRKTCEKKYYNTLFTTKHIAEGLLK